MDPRRRGNLTLGPGEENPRLCVKKEITEDTYVSAIRPVHPLGTHHTLVTLGDASSDCTTAVVNGLLYAAGVGSDGFHLPPGVAIKLPKGKFLNLGLHIYNTSDTDLTGTSAIEIQTMKAEDVQYESEAVLSGPFDINIPPGQTTIKDDCRVTTDQSVYVLFPHMHQHGTHFKTTFTMNGVPKVIHDGNYQFEEQYQIPLDPVMELHAGDTVTTECTYQNATEKTLTFGESSDTEMCFSVLFRYPAQGVGFCTGGARTNIVLDGPPCAAAGAPGNEKGVGEECTQRGGQCAGNASANLCLADVVQGPPANFCTLPCQVDSECGADASCSGSQGRKICVPSACAGTFSVRTGDAGAGDAG